MSAHAEASRVDTVPATGARALELDKVSKVFDSDRGAITALSGITTTVHAGEFVCVLGPSGCGKSTLLAIAAGLDTATSGRVTLDGREVTSPVLDAGFVFQRDLLLDWRTCESNVLLQFQLRGLPVAPHRDRARELLAMVGLEQFADRRPYELSGGMRQRVAICRALVHDPPLLFMDEPFGALDALTREDLNTELARLTAASGTAVVFVTHSIDEAVFLGDRVLVMSRGPGRIAGDVRIDLPRPRQPAVREDPAYVQYTAHLRRLLQRSGAIEEQR